MIAHRCKAIAAAMGPEEAERFLSWDETEEIWQIWLPGHDRPAWRVRYCPFCGCRLAPGVSQRNIDRWASEGA